MNLGVVPVIQVHDLTDEQVAKWIISHHKDRPKKGDQDEHLFRGGGFRGIRSGYQGTTIGERNAERR